MSFVRKIREEERERERERELRLSFLEEKEEYCRMSCIICGL